ncbi:unnamed protein product [Withania somnifera]
MESQDFKNPEKTHRAIHDHLRSCQFPLFECKVVVDELIESAHEYSNRSMLTDHRYVLKHGIKFDISMYKKIKENDSNAMETHMFHFNCMKNGLERNICCPTCNPS